ncbi:MAG: hypothetical protein Q7U12_04665, partial [Undibacterium sp.]|nr:hypothetical protein [Undibacterium sp.]
SSDRHIRYAGERMAIKTMAGPYVLMLQLPAPSAVKKPINSRTRIPMRRPDRRLTRIAAQQM